MKKKIKLTKEQCGFELQKLKNILRVDVIDEKTLEIEVELQE